MKKMARKVQPRDEQMSENQTREGWVKEALPKMKEKQNWERKSVMLRKDHNKSRKRLEMLQKELTNGRGALKKTSLHEHYRLLSIR